MNNRSVLTEVNPEPSEDGIAVPPQDEVEGGVEAEEEEEEEEEDETDAVPANSENDVESPSGQQEKSASSNEKQDSTASPKASKRPKKFSWRPKALKPEEKSLRYFYFASFGVFQMSVWLILTALGELFFKAPSKLSVGCSIYAAANRS